MSGLAGNVAETQQAVRTFRMARGLVSATIIGTITVGPALWAQAGGDSAHEEARAFSLVNDSRRGYGLTSLEVVHGLQKLARDHSRRMADDGRVYHNPNLQAEIATIGRPVRWSGENIGVGPNVDSIHDDFLQSPSHRNNILRAGYTAVGVGVVRRTSSGYLYVTQVFIDVPPSSPVATPASVQIAEPPRDDDTPAEEPAGITAVEHGRVRPSPMAAPAQTRALKVAGDGWTRTAPAASLMVLALSIALANMLRTFRPVDTARTRGSIPVPRAVGVGRSGSGLGLPA